MPSNTSIFAEELRAARKAAGLSLKDLFERTRINPEFLEAIESGRFHVLPEVYVRLFLKTYAREVGLNVQEVLDGYERLVRPPAPPAARPLPGRARSPAIGPILGGVAALVLLAAIGTLALKNQEPAGPEPVASDAGPAPRLPAEGLRPDVEPAEAPSESLERDSRPPYAPPSESLEVATGRAERVVSAYSLPPGALSARDSLLVLFARAAEPARTRVIADGEPVFEGLLPAGAERTWNARSRFRIEVDPPSALALSLQGSPLQTPGNTGRKLRLFISRASIWVEEIEPAVPPEGR